MIDDNSKPPLWQPILDRFDAIRHRLGDLLETVAEKWEWAFAGLFYVATTICLAPFRFLSESRVGKVTKDVKETLEEKSVSGVFHIREFFERVAQRIFPRWLFWPFFWLADWIRYAASVAFEFILERLFPRWLFWPFYLLADWIRYAASVAFEFTEEWFDTRDVRKLKWALPAILLSTPLLAALVLSVLYSPAEKIQHYESARFQAIQDKDQKKADFLLVRLNQLGFRRQDEADFQSAIVLFEEGNTEACQAKMRGLASLSEPGFAPAHLWLAAALLDGTLQEPDPWERIETHANHAISLEPDHPIARRFLVECQIHRGQLDEAATEMDSLRKLYPDLNAELAHHFATRGEMAKARKYARDTIQYHQALVERSQQEQPPDVLLTAKGYYRVAEAYGLTGERETQILLLKEGIKVHPTAGNLRFLLIELLSVVVQDFDAIDEHQRDYLHQLLVVDPTNKLGLSKLFAMIQDGHESAEEMVDQFLHDLETPAQITKAIGDIYLTAEKYEQAKKLYRAACDKDVKMAYAWNNLAWIWSNIEPINMDRAIECTDRAMEAKQDANFFETRGQILVKMQRWQEAVENLEQALNSAVPNPEDAHRSLAASYEALGKKEQAEAHRAVLSP